MSTSAKRQGRSRPRTAQTYELMILLDRAREIVAACGREDLGPDLANARKTQLSAILVEAYDCAGRVSRRREFAADIGKMLNLVEQPDFPHAVSNLLERARLEAVNLYAALNTPDLVVESQATPSRYSRALARWAAQLLPMADRIRYLEEFQSELHDLRTEPCRRQLCHALRLLTRALCLRHALRQRAPVRERAW